VLPSSLHQEREKFTTNRGLARGQRWFSRKADAPKKETVMTESYQFILKALQKRLVQSTPITAAELEKLSLSETLNLLYALQGTWGSTGDFSTTFKALSKIVGAEALWMEPPAEPEGHLSQLGYSLCRKVFGLTDRSPLDLPPNHWLAGVCWSCKFRITTMGARRRRKKLLE
jgi:hypothetical protein